MKRRKRDSSYKIKIIRKMFSVQQRISAIFSYALTMCMFLLPIIGFSSYFILSNEPKSVDIKVGDIYFSTATRKFPEAKVHFKLNADFTPVFNWNTKMIFVYAAVEYQTKKNTRNEVVIWDRIVRASDKYSLNGNIKNKYTFRDFEKNGLAGNNATLNIYWDTIPNVGALFVSQKGSKSIQFPVSAASK